MCSAPARRTRRTMRVSPRASLTFSPPKDSSSSLKVTSAGTTSTSTTSRAYCSRPGSPPSRQACTTWAVAYRSRTARSPNGLSRWRGIPGCLWLPSPSLWCPCPTACAAASSSTRGPRKCSRGWLGSQRIRWTRWSTTGTRGRADGCPTGARVKEESDDRGASVAVYLDHSGEERRGVHRGDHPVCRPPNRSPHPVGHRERWVDGWHGGDHRGVRPPLRLDRRGQHAGTPRSKLCRQGTFLPRGL